MLRKGPRIIARAYCPFRLGIFSSVFLIQKPSYDWQFVSLVCLIAGLLQHITGPTLTTRPPTNPWCKGADVAATGCPCCVAARPHDSRSRAARRAPLKHRHRGRHRTAFAAPRAAALATVVAVVARARRAAMAPAALRRDLRLRKLCDS